ncbi:MAG: lipoyl(octanoyl) transferase LipB [Bacteroidia bacterium]|nr:lipoyl(octanoyl) transferase LipB [Bacteroidia bacterium]
MAYPLAQQQKAIEVRDLGLMAYTEAWAYQRALVEGIVATKVANRARPAAEQQPTPNYLLYCEHPHVYTLGKSGAPTNLLRSPEALAAEGVTFVHTDRGGDITYHGPGQLVGYPILDLENFTTDIGHYLRTLEEAIIRTCADYGVTASRMTTPGFTGVWVAPQSPYPRKIAALGVKCTRWVTLHGFAFNLTTDLSFFGGIVPCGIDPSQKGVTSLYQETGLRPDRAEVRDRLTGHLLAVLGATVAAPVAPVSAAAPR